MASTDDAVSIDGVAAPNTNYLVHYSRIPLLEHTMLHKVQIKDKAPTELHDIVLLAQEDTIYHDVEFELGPSGNTMTHNVELSYIPGAEDGEDDEIHVIARGELVEPEVLIKTATEDILVERVHPALIIADPNAPEAPEMIGKTHMDGIAATPQHI